VPKTITNPRSEHVPIEAAGGHRPILAEHTHDRASASGLARPLEHGRSPGQTIQHENRVASGQLHRRAQSNKGKPELIEKLEFASPNQYAGMARLTRMPNNEEGSSKSP
jgi:hypothetical protein